MMNNFLAYLIFGLLAINTLLSLYILLFRAGQLQRIQAKMDALCDYLNVELFVSVGIPEKYKAVKREKDEKNTEK